MIEYHPQTMLTLDELKEIKDISGLTLYNAETKRIPLLTPEEQTILLDEAHKGSREARNRIIMNYLTLMIWFAQKKMYERKLKHSDIADLIGIANVNMLEKFPKALEQEDPIRYLLKDTFYEMKKYSIYDDPMIHLHRSRKLDPDHPESVSFEAYERDLVNTLPATDIKIEEEPFNSSLHEAITKLTPTRRTAIIRRYGLYGNPRETLDEIAQSKGVTPQSVSLAELSARRSLAKMLPSPSKR
jgi:RNA polymerase sigma factor (sigma-70 family)